MITERVGAAIRSARLAGEARVLTPIETIKREESAGRGLHDACAPDDVDLPDQIKATYWVEEFRPRVIARHLILTGPTPLPQRDLDALLKAYGFAYDWASLTKFGGVRSSTHDGRAVMAAIEPISGDLSALTRDAAGTITTLIDPRDMQVGLLPSNGSGRNDHRMARSDHGTPSHDTPSQAGTGIGEGQPG